jgi:SAM-dependent methyltransferase
MTDAVTDAVTDVAVGARPAVVGDDYADLAGFFDRFVEDAARWRRRNSTYHRLIAQVHRFHIPPGRSVLEVGSGTGDLLAELAPARGVGVDVSGGMVARAAEEHPELEFVQAAGEQLELDETFDYVVLSDVVPYAHDLVALFDRVAAHSAPSTRVVVHSYSRLWRPVIRLAELLRLKPRKPIRNWVSPDDVRNLLELSDFEVISLERRVLFPKRVPVLSFLLNGIVANVWPFNHLCLTWWIVARPRARSRREATVTVVCPCRNERGNVRGVVDRLPELGLGTELVFVEGGSTDGTREEIERVIAERPERPIRLVPQRGKGKGDAVRAGFAAARNDLLMILDGDLSVAPEDLGAFYRVWAEGKAELVNGSRLVYDVERGAMRFANMVGNKLFSVLLRAIIGQQVKDTLCGTKVLSRGDYERIVAGRAYFGEFDPFGDFDLLLGAARLNLRIVDLPVRYRTRTYGSTNISRWRHGLLLLHMTTFAFWKFRVEVIRLRRRGPLAAPAQPGT